MRKSVLILTVIAFAFASAFTSCKKESSKQITAFSITTPSATGTIDEQAKTITVTLPGGSAVTSLTPTISISAKATVSPASGVATDFTNPVQYTVTAEDGSTSVYTVTVISPKTKNIVKIQLEGYPEWTADTVGGLIANMGTYEAFVIYAKKTGDFPYMHLQSIAEVCEDSTYLKLDKTEVPSFLKYYQETAYEVSGKVVGDWVPWDYTSGGTSAQLYVTEVDLVNLTISGRIEGVLLNTPEAFTNPVTATQKKFTCAFTKVDLKRTTTSSTGIKNQINIAPQISKAEAISITKDNNRILRHK